MHSEGNTSWQEFNAGIYAVVRCVLKRSPGSCISENFQIFHQKLQKSMIGPYDFQTRGNHYTFEFIEKWTKKK